jgi:hypothetical protein
MKERAMRKSRKTTIHTRLFLLAELAFIAAAEP